MKRLFPALLIYNFLYILLSPFIIIYLLSRRDSRKRWKEYLGYGSPNTSVTPVILVHGVSVGEILSLIPLVKLLKEETEVSFILSTTIEDAIRISEQHANLFEDRVFLPLDFSWTMNKFIDRITPVAVIISETDFWPNMLYHCHRQKIPLYLVNGRISSKIFEGALKTVPYSSQLLLSFTKFYVQRELDSKRLRDLGIPSGKVIVAGNSKYEGVLQIKEPSQRTSMILDHLGKKACNIVIGGSTHPGEEEMMLSLFKSCSAMKLKLIIAPRLIQRAHSIMDLAVKNNLVPVLYSQFDEVSGTFSEVTSDWDILVIDLLGELKYVYSVAKVVFIGGTFSTIGGHNFLEAAVHRKAVIVGPDIHNFSEDGERFIQNSALIQINSKAEFATKVMELLHTSVTDETGERAFKLLMDNQGAAKLTSKDIVADLLKSGCLSQKNLTKKKNDKENDGE